MARLKAALLSPITGVVVFATVLTACVAGILVTKAVKAREAVLRQNDLELRNLAHSLAVHSFQTMQGVEAALSAIADRLSFDTDRSGQTLAAALRRHRQQLPQVRDFGVLDAEGRWLHATFTPQPGETQADTSFFAVHRDIDDNDIQISAPLSFRASETPSVIVSRRLSGSDGRFAGVVLAVLDLGYFNSFYRTFAVGPGGRLALTRIDGRIIADSRDAAPGTDVSAFTRRLAGSGELNGSGTIISPLDGIEKAIAWEQSRNYPLLSTVSRARAEVLAPWRKSVQSDVIVVLGLIAAIVLISAVLGLQFRHRLATERRLSEREARYRLLTENAGDVVLQCRTDGTIDYVSPALHRILGWPEAHWLGKPHRDFVHAEDVEALATALRSVASGSAMAVATYRVTRADQSHIFVEAQFRQAPGDGDEIVVCLRDVTDRRRMEDELRVLNRQLGALASTDGLTGLPNRRAFDAALLKDVTSGRFAVLMIDVDFFKPFNDYFGHLKGDECLKRVGATIALVSARHGGFAARYGGEEFALILPLTTIAQAEAIANDLREAVRALGIAHPTTPHQVLTVSIGVSSREQRGPDPLDVLREADFALYEAKRQGRDCVVSFSIDAPAPPLAPQDDEALRAHAHMHRT